MIAAIGRQLDDSLHDDDVGSLGAGHDAELRAQVNDGRHWSGDREALSRLGDVGGETAGLQSTGPVISNKESARAFQDDSHAVVISYFDQPLSQRHAVASRQMRPIIVPI